MPRTTFAPENKTATALFPKLSLEKGEKARIFLIEAESPLFEFVHTLRACRIGPDNKPVMETFEGRNGPATRIARDYVGRPLCFGDINILLEKGIDPDNCPICRAASRGEGTDAPERRYAMHVIRYATQPGSFNLANPFSCSSVVWAFTDRTFNALADLAQEYEGGFRQHDVFLNCTNKAFQNFEIQMAGQAAAMVSQQIMQIVVDTYKNNQAADLSVFCGRRSEIGYVTTDLQDVARAHRLAYGGSEAAQAYEPVAAVGVPLASIDDLLSAQAGAPVAAPTNPVEDIFAQARGEAQPIAQQPVQPAPVAPQAAPAVASMDELMAQLKGTQENPAPVPEQPAPVLQLVPEPEPATEAPKPAPPSFDDLLAGLTQT